MSWEWEQKARKGAPMPNGLSLEDQAAYQAMSALYARWNAGRLSKIQAAEEKRRIRAEYERRTDSREFGNRMTEHSVRLWKSVEAAAREYWRKPNRENADRLLESVYGTGFLKHPEECPWEDEHEEKSTDSGS